MGDAIAELTTAWHVANVEGDEVEASALLLELSAAIKERDGPSATPMLDRVVAVLWPESMLELQEAPPVGGNGVLLARDASQPLVARPGGNGAGNGDGRQGRAWSMPRSHPELSSWPTPITALACTVRELEVLRRCLGPQGL
jgi:hypothetical protein